MEEKKCPKCGGPLSEYPALSRRDNKTYICSPCGTDEALEDFFGAESRKLSNELKGWLND